MEPKLGEMLFNSLKSVNEVIILKEQLRKNNEALMALSDTHTGEVAMILEDLVAENNKVLEINFNI
jgi:hypothetical protein